MWFRWVWLLKTLKDLNRQHGCHTSFPPVVSHLEMKTKSFPPHHSLRIGLRPMVSNASLLQAEAWLSGSTWMDLLRQTNYWAEEWTSSLWFVCWVFDPSVDPLEPLRFKVCSKGEEWREGRGPWKYEQRSAKCQTCPLERVQQIPLRSQCHEENGIVALLCIFSWNCNHLLQFHSFHSLWYNKHFFVITYFPLP